MKTQDDNSVAVVIPFYNRSQFLQRLLDSIAIQTLPVAKVYIIDNGSSLEETVKAWRIISSHQLRSKCLFTSSLGKGNANYARNLGYQLAETKYVAFLDSDDWWEKQHLAQSAHCLQRSSKAAVYSGSVIHYKNSVLSNKSIDIAHFNDPFSFIMSPEGHIAQTSSYVVNKQLLQDSVLWSEQLKRHQDLDYFAEIYYNSLGWCYLPQANVNMDKIEGGVDINKIDYASMIQFYHKWNPLFPKAVRKYYLTYSHHQT